MSSTVDKLKNFGNGASAHTANKCAFYIEMCIEKGKDKLRVELEELANRAMESGDWRELAMRMKSWW